MSSQAFDLLILGSSSASPTSERNPSAQLLNISERYFLIDCGEATQIQLRRFKAKFQAIDHIFISHLHGDHFFGLLPKRIKRGNGPFEQSFRYPI